MAQNTLILLDYSGTLCFDAARFGETEMLAQELALSGLDALGVTTPEFFWSRVVNPTWIEGSTTGIGYAALMERRLNELLAVPERALHEAVRRFTGNWFSAFRIDPRWKETLHRLQDGQDRAVLVATDHYAEATGAVIGSLAALGIKALPLGRAEPPDEDTACIVANSADLGVLKTDRLFWEAVLRRFPGWRGRSVILVDDFGCNEAEGSDYRQWPRVLARRDETVALIEAAFLTTPRVISFFGAEATEKGGDIRSLEKVLRDVHRLCMPSESGAFRSP